LSRWLGCFTVDWQLACFPALDFKRLCNYLLLRTALWSLIFNLTKRCLEPGASAEVNLARSLKSIDNLFIQKFYLFKNLKPEMLIILIHSNICANLKTSVRFIFDSDMFFFLIKSTPYPNQSCHFHIQDIRRVRRLHLSTATALGNSFISSNFTTAIHYTLHISHANLNKLRLFKSIQNSSARVITNNSKY